jgi:para-nitrobenzyl esterase
MRVALMGLALASVLGSSALAGPTVAVTGGRIEGKMSSDGGASFKGIPFAAPPVGDLRWREPARVKAWPGLLQANRYGPSCMQKAQTWNAEETARMSEDCLYLNVWTPSTDFKGKRPVMVWIFGGSNTGGSASKALYDGADLARKGVIVVTINYRVGLFGFFAHPALTAESPHHASGDYGLLDQVAALKWVRDNIAHFGGDPGNVTIFGQSAGGGDVAFLLVSPLARGLFQKAIQESSGGGVRDLPSLAEVERWGLDVAAQAHAPEGTPGLAFLRKLPAEQLQRISSGERGGPAAIDGWFLAKGPREAFAEGLAANVPLMIGNNAQEQKGATPATVREAVTEAFGADAGAALAYYGFDRPGDGRADPLFGTAILQVEADTSQRCPSILQATWEVQHGRPVFEYQFDLPIPGEAAPHHSSELPYVFGNLPPSGASGPDAQTTHRVSDAVQTYWTNFARTGVPSGEGLTVWPRFDPAQRGYLEFTALGPVAGKGLRRTICDLYIDGLVHARSGAAGHDQASR